MKLGFVESVKLYGDDWRFGLRMHMRHAFPDHEEVVGGICYHPMTSDNLSGAIMRLFCNPRLKRMRAFWKTTTV